MIILSGQVETVVERWRWACEADFLLSSRTSAEQLSLCCLVWSSLSKVVCAR